MAEGALELRGVAAAYDGREVLAGVDARLERGEIVGLIGPNGVGKSTLLRVCAHLVAPAAGEVRADGERVADLRADERARRVAFLPQTVAWSFPFRAGEVVLMGRHPRRSGFGFEGDADREVARACLERTDTWHLRDRPIDALSSGELQRVMLAAALAQEPRYLLLDEPTSNLDLRHQAEFLAVVRELPARGTGVLLASHDLSLAAAAADRLWLLSEGHLAADGPPAEVLTPAHLEAAYGLPCEVQPGPVSTRVLPRWDRYAREEGTA